jgi:hypothetical protein
MRVISRCVATRTATHSSSCCEWRDASHAVFQMSMDMVDLLHVLLLGPGTDLR